MSKLFEEPRAANRVDDYVDTGTLSERFEYMPTDSSLSVATTLRDNADNHYHEEHYHPHLPQP
ncbi:hypothetical protein Tsubulata_007391 [Turnera subulata]|uniref:Uncharacterized protein n=1 Tax=Turnera subulata TaxID=218843 RepID=A0A9Q0J663_9ROSI|nr:hypothetical protein Tsubulata_007391 [Turnera subulata]